MVLHMLGNSKMGSPTVREFGIMKVATLTQVNSLTTNQTDLDGSLILMAILMKVNVQMVN